MSRKENFEKRKRQAWAYLLGYYVDWNFMPTLQEISDNAFSPDKLTREGARYVLQGLEKDGRVKINSQKRRGIELVCDMNVKESGMNMKGGVKNGF